jgi:hypothetical protein
MRSSSALAADRRSAGPCARTGGPSSACRSSQGARSTQVPKAPRRAGSLFR